MSQQQAEAEEAQSVSYQIPRPLPLIPKKAQFQEETYVPQ